MDSRSFRKAGNGLSLTQTGVSRRLHQLESQSHARSLVSSTTACRASAARRVLAAELFNLTAKVKMTQIPHRGAPSMLVDLMGGRIELSFATMPSAMAHVRSGKLRGVAVTSLKRYAVAPELPTVAESGLPGFEMVAWQGLLAPKATPPALIQFLYRETAAIVQQPEVRKQLSSEGGEPVGNPPDEFARWVKAEIAKWTRVVREANMRPE